MGKPILFSKTNLPTLVCVGVIQGFWLSVKGNGGSGKEPACQCRRHKRCGFDPWVRKIPGRRTWQSTPVFLPGESHGQKTLAGTVRRVAKSWIRLKWLSTLANIADLQCCVSFRCTASDSVVYLYFIYIFFFRFFPTRGYYKILNLVS